MNNYYFWQKVRILFRWKVFLISFIGVFLMVFIPQLKTRIIHNSPPTPAIISPVLQKQEVLDKLRPKLKERLNNFFLKRNTSLIPESLAVSSFNEAGAYILVDLDTGTILAEKNAQASTFIASLTKIMTAIVSLDLASLDEVFTVSVHASNIEPTKIGVVANQKLKTWELINALMLTSANDAAEVIKEGINTKYGGDIFVDAMNEKAKILGLTSTSFANPQGLDHPGNFSSAQDLAVLTEYALKNYPYFSETVKKDYQFLPEDTLHKQFDLFNWNGLLGVYPNIQGVKIGNTKDAGYTTIVVSKRGGKKIAAIVLGAGSTYERDLWAADLLDLGFEKTLKLPPVKVTKQQLKEKYSSWKYWN